MAAQTVSGLANWEARRDQQRKSSNWRRSSSSLARNSHQPPLESQPMSIIQSSAKFSGQRRAEQSAFHFNSERDPMSGSLTDPRFPSRVDTTSTPLHGLQHSHQASIAHATPSPAQKSSSFTTLLKSARLAPNSSVHTSRGHSLRPSSRELIASSQPASAVESEVIDLTLEDTEDELPTSDMLVPHSTKPNHQYVGLGSSRQTLSSRCSPPIAPQQSLFTPPPARRRTRVLMDYLAAPSFPKGLTKADYQLMLDPSVPLPSPTVTGPLGDSCLAESLITEGCTPEEQKDKERELDAVSSSRKHKQSPPANGADVFSSAFLEAFCEHTIIPLYDDDSYPLLTTLDLVTNSRFHFAHTWRGHASRLWEVELDWMSKFGLLRKVCIWAQSVNTSSPRLPGTTSYVSSEQLRPWELVLPENSPQEEGKNHVSNEQALAVESRVVAEVDSNCSSVPDAAPPGPKDTLEPALSNVTVTQGSMAAGMEDDIHQYFNGLGDSPAKHTPSRQHPAPTHTFRPRLLQSAGHLQMNSLELGFPSSELDPRLAETGDHECFLGVPPSPPTADAESPIAPRHVLDPSLEHVDYSPASPSNIFETSPASPWTFEHANGLPPDDNAGSSHHDTPTAVGTIDPSLLNPKQSQKPLGPPRDPTPKRRSKLPEPVIYIRRPIDSSSLPLISGKRPVRIKYRDSGGCSAPPPQTESHEAPPHLVGNPTEQSRNDTDEPPRAKRRSAPSRKLREYQSGSGSDPDFIPETSTSKLKIKIKRSSLNYQGVESGTVLTMSSCHQCRNTSARPKMLCSNVVNGRVCGKRFCNRCILYRYPDITFDERSSGFLCPACTNTCNCSLCSRNRGEEFISMRLGGLATSLFKSKVTLVQDIDRPLHRAPSPSRNANVPPSVSAATTSTPKPGVVPAQSQFWAHVYGIEGERVGSAFMAREQMDRLQTRGPSPPPQPPKRHKARKPRKSDKDRERPKGPRVFVGHPLASWKLRAVRDLEPSVDLETLGKGKGKEGGGTGTGTVSINRRYRCYVGNPAPLHEPYGRMPDATNLTPPSSRCSSPGLYTDGSLTALSRLEADYWPQPEVGEGYSWVPPSGAIACGVSLGPSGLPGPSTRGLSGPVLPDAVGTRPDAGGLLGRGEKDSDVEIGTDVDDEHASSSTPLSEEDLARAISAALAALSMPS